MKFKPITPGKAHARGPAVKVPGSYPPGPIPAHTRLKMGQTDYETNPHGQGRPSTEQKVVAGSRRGW